MTTSPIRNAYDVVIVGARVAGAATAMLLAAAGLRVLAFDRTRYATDTVSTHALMRPAVLLLKKWGLLERLEEEGTPAIRRTTFWYSDGHDRDVVEVAIKPRFGVDALYGPRRTVIDPILVDAARDAGAEVRHGVRLVEVLRQGDERVSGVLVHDEAGDVRKIDARLVIGADGRNSAVARHVGAAPYVQGRYASSVVYGYFRDLPVDGNRWYFRPGVGAGAIPTNDDETLLFVSVDCREEGAGGGALRSAFASRLSECAPDVASRLRHARLVGKLRSFSGMRGFLRQPWGSGWALVGDAGYMSDPITAHGITSALRDAALLGRSVATGTSLLEYQTVRDDLSQTFFEVSDRISSYEWDIPTVQQFHHIMSVEMAREEQVLLRLPNDSPLAA